MLPDRRRSSGIFCLINAARSSSVSLNEVQVDLRRLRDLHFWSLVFKYLPLPKCLVITGSNDWTDDWNEDANTSHDRIEAAVPERVHLSRAAVGQATCWPMYEWNVRARARRVYIRCSRSYTKYAATIAWESSMFPIPSAGRSHRKTRRFPKLIRGTPILNSTLQVSWGLTFSFDIVISSRLNIISINKN